MRQTILVSSRNIECDDLASNPGIQRKLHPWRPTGIYEESRSHRELLSLSSWLGLKRDT